MVYGIKGTLFFSPIKLMPTNLSIPEPQGNTPNEKKGGKVLNYTVCINLVDRYLILLLDIES